MELTLQRWDSDYAGFTAQKRGRLQGQERKGRSGGGLGVSLGRRAKGREHMGKREWPKNRRQRSCIGQQRARGQRAGCRETYRIRLGVGNRQRSQQTKLPPIDCFWNLGKEQDPPRLEQTER